MATDKKLSSLVFNTLTQAQYDSATKSEDEFYLTPDDTDEKLASKQDTLVSGTNIKTINGTSLLGSGDITISGGGGDSYTAVIELTASQFQSYLTTGVLTLDSAQSNLMSNATSAVFKYNNTSYFNVAVSKITSYSSGNFSFTYRLYAGTSVLSKGFVNSSTSFVVNIDSNGIWSISTPQTFLPVPYEYLGTINKKELWNGGDTQLNVQFYEHNIYMLYETSDATFCIRFAFVNNVSDTYTTVSALQGYLGTNFVKGCSGYMNNGTYGNAYSVTYNKVSGIVNGAQAVITYDSSSSGLTITDTIKEMS